MFSDIFLQRPFQAVELTAAFERIVYLPSMLGDFGASLFPVRPSRFRQVAIAKNEGYLQLIPTSPIGAPPVELEKRPADMRSFMTRRLAKGSTVYAESLGGLLLMPEFQQLQGLQAEIADRAARIRTDIDFTMEHMRLGAILGRVIDADGSTVLDDWFLNWDIPQADWIIFPLDNPTANLRALVRALRRDLRRTSAGGWIENRTELHALCGNAFYEKLVTHPMIERTFLNWQAATDLRGDIADDFAFGGVVWHDYRGTDDLSTMFIADDEVHFFPVGANECFHCIYGPAEFDPFVNQPGRDIYALSIPDRDRGAWFRVEAYNYPLFVCTRPEMLRRGKLG